MAETSCRGLTLEVLTDDDVEDLIRFDLALEVLINDEDSIMFGLASSGMLYYFYRKFFILFAILTDSYTFYKIAGILLKHQKKVLALS